MFIFKFLHSFFVYNSLLNDMLTFLKEESNNS